MKTVDIAGKIFFCQKRLKGKEQNLRKIPPSSPTYKMRIPKGKERERGAENILKEILTKNITNLIKS